MYALYKSNMQKNQQEMNSMADKRESSVKKNAYMHELCKTENHSSRKTVD